MIYKDLKNSTFLIKYGKFVFYFSSELYYNKFKKLMPSYIKDESLRLSIRYNHFISFDDLFLLSLYKKIEKRGFMVTYDGKLLNEKCYFEAKILSCSFD